VRAAVIGAGFISRQHIGAIQAIGGDVELAAVCDLSPGIAACVAGRFHIPRWFTNHLEMLETISPDVVHITTPTTSHVQLAMDALNGGAHVLIEKPITPTYEDWRRLHEHAVGCQRQVIEDHNYIFNPPFLKLVQLIEDSKFGDVVHVDAIYCLKIHEPASPFADPNIPHDSMRIRGHAIHDFLPHMAYLVQRLLGSHTSVRALWTKRDSQTSLPQDEFRGLVQFEHGTANLAFSSHSQPDGYWMTVYGTKMKARINFFEGMFHCDDITRGQGPLMYLRNGFAEAKSVRHAAIRSLARKLSGGPGIYEGLYRLVRRFYSSLNDPHIDPPVSAAQIDATVRLVCDLTEPAYYA